MPPAIFKSRFRPKWDPKALVFVATKKINLGTKVILPGTMFHKDALCIKERIVQIHFEQRFMDYVEDPKTAEDFVVKYEANKKAEAEAKQKLDEAAKLAAAGQGK